MWAEATQNERDELVQVLTDRLARQAAGERSKTDRVTFFFIDRRVLDDGSLLVTARLPAEGRERSVSWRLAQHNMGFHIVDVVTEAGGIIADLRSRFMSFADQSDGIRKFSKYLATQF